MSWYALAFLGTAPLGNLLAGWLADLLGAPVTVRIAGVCSAAGALAFAFWLPALRAQVRPIYVRIGLLSEAVAGVEAATELTLPSRRRRQGPGRAGGADFEVPTRVVHRAVAQPHAARNGGCLSRAACGCATA
jgi:hypothetical protein